MNSRKIIVWFLLRNKFSTPKDEKRKNYENERNKKLQEKYRPITQRVLNPSENPYIGSR